MSLVLRRASRSSDQSPASPCPAQRHGANLVPYERSRALDIGLSSLRHLGATAIAHAMLRMWKMPARLSSSHSQTCARKTAITQCCYSPRHWIRMGAPTRCVGRAIRLLRAITFPRTGPTTRTPTAFSQAGPRRVRHGLESTQPLFPTGPAPSYPGTRWRLSLVVRLASTRKTLRMLRNVRCRD